MRFKKFPLGKGATKKLIQHVNFFHNVSLGVDPPPPILEKVYILNFFAPFPKISYGFVVVISASGRFN